MKFIAILPPQYDYLAATLVEGLQELGHQMIASENTNYAQGFSRRQIQRHAQNADAILVFSNKRTKVDWVRWLEHEAMVFIDGSDTQRFMVPAGIRFRAIFKREYSRAWFNTFEEPVYPLPFAIEKRYVPQSFLSEKDIDASFIANLDTNLIRYSIYYRMVALRQRAQYQIELGGTGERAYTLRGRHKGQPQATPKYFHLLDRSRVAVSAAGVGYDCGRYWEILARGSALLTQELDIVIPDPLIDGEHCIEFKSLAEFDERLEWCLDQPHLVQEIAQRGHAYAMAHHTTVHRAQYFLNCLRLAQASKSLCESFYREDERSWGAMRKWWYQTL